MAKYSVGDSSFTNEGDSCELCGEETSSLTEATIEGATLLLCSDCRPDQSGSGSADSGQSSRSSGDRKRDVIEKTTDSNARLWNSDTSRWESEGTGYDDDPLPYLVQDYATRVSTARTDAGVDIPTLAVELEVDELDLIAVEQGQASKEDVPGAVIMKLEDHFSIQLTVE